MALIKLRNNERPALANWDEFTRDFDGVFGDFDKVFAPFRKTTERLWSAPVDIHETDKDYKITLDLPGMKKEDIHIEIVNTQVSIYGERKGEQESKDAKTHRLECWRGQFRRTFNLPENVDQQKIEADYSDGVLHVSIPKVEAVQPKKIAIK